MSYEQAAVAISVASIVIAILSIGVSLLLRAFSRAKAEHDELEKIVRENRQEYVRDVGEIRVSLAEIGGTVANINENVDKLSPEAMELQRRARQ